jgi:3D (Asp-Asp-Asp) domain-containing protein
LSMTRAALLFGLIVSVASLGPWGVAHAQEELPVGSSAIVSGTDGRGLRVRSGPGMSHRVLAVLPEGTTVSILAGPVSDGHDDWYQVAMNGAPSGWSLDRYLSPAPVSSSQRGRRTVLAKITAYADGVGGVPLNARTATGARTGWGVVAVDPRVVPLGSKLTIQGYEGTFTAEDTGPAIRGTAIDLWLPDAAAARRYGIQYRQVTVLREGRAR